ncbi:hypothetical protein EV44_g6235 [Erysiphe necator]|uniref:Uncharacterized protein n=1 Tax=Uncinula necator TaxID=52586 RepID=A0A0B1PF76_UNCNE|nr:hypothetical protein EV44_g6235 [Erysiphe necator]
MFTIGNVQLRPTKSSPSRGAGVNAQHALHVWDSQEDSHHPSFPSGSPIHHRGSQSSSFLHHFPLSTFCHEAPHDRPREYRVKGSILSQRTSDESKLLAQMVGCWLDFLEVVGWIPAWLTRGEAAAARRKEYRRSS